MEYVFVVVLIISSALPFALYMIASGKRGERQLEVYTKRIHEIRDRESNQRLEKYIQSKTEKIKLPVWFNQAKYNDDIYISDIEEINEDFLRKLSVAHPHDKEPLVYQQRLNGLHIALDDIQDDKYAEEYEGFIHEEEILLVPFSQRPSNAARTHWLKSPTNDLKRFEYSYVEREAPDFNRKGGTVAAVISGIAMVAFMIYDIVNNGFVYQYADKALERIGTFIMCYLFFGGLFFLFGYNAVRVPNYEVMMRNDSNICREDKLKYMKLPIWFDSKKFFYEVYSNGGCTKSQIPNLSINNVDCIFTLLSTKRGDDEAVKEYLIKWDNLAQIMMNPITRTDDYRCITENEYIKDYCVTLCWEQKEEG